MLPCGLIATEGCLAEEAATVTGAEPGAEIQPARIWPAVSRIHALRPASGRTTRALGESAPRRTPHSITHGPYHLPPAPPGAPGCCPPRCPSPRERRRSRMALAVGTSPRSLPQSSMGRFVGLLRLQLPRRFQSRHQHAHERVPRHWVPRRQCRQCSCPRAVGLPSIDVVSERVSDQKASYYQTESQTPTFFTGLEVE